jgi:hypothetical protein
LRVLHARAPTSKPNGGGFGQSESGDFAAQGDPAKINSVPDEQKYRRRNQPDRPVDS